MIRKGTKVKWKSSVGNLLEGVVVGFLMNTSGMRLAEVKVRLVSGSYYVTIVPVHMLKRIPR